MDKFRSRTHYSESDLAILTQVRTLGVKECARLLKRSEFAIADKAYRLGLIDSNLQLRKRYTYEDVKDAIKYDVDKSTLINCNRQHLAMALLELREELLNGE